MNKESGLNPTTPHQIIYITSDIVHFYRKSILGLYPPDYTVYAGLLLLVIIEKLGFICDLRMLLTIISQWHVYFLILVCYNDIFITNILIEQP